ncbi:MAG: GNAT family N-acetyltransferase [Neptuniibacter sp.]
MQQLGYSQSEQSLLANIAAVRKAGGEIFIAENSGKVLGCVCAIIDVRLAEGKQGEIVSLVVSEDHRGLGLGKGLVSNAENWLFQRTDIIRVRANHMRTEAHKFYQGMGYEEVKSQKVLTKKAMP